MSIISANKEKKTTAYNNYITQRTLRDMAENRRREAMADKERISRETHLEEMEVIKEMLALDTGENGMTAQEISRALDGKISKHEVAGNLTTYNNRYGITPADVRYKKEVEQRQFVEIDDTGTPIKNGQIIKKASRKNRYHMTKNAIEPSHKEPPFKKNKAISGEMIKSMIAAYERNTYI